jgi:hypothetical protein
MKHRAQRLLVAVGFGRMKMFGRDEQLGQSADEFVAVIVEVERVLDHAMPGEIPPMRRQAAIPRQHFEAISVADALGPAEILLVARGGVQTGQRLEQIAVDLREGMSFVNGAPWNVQDAVTVAERTEFGSP